MRLPNIDKAKIDLDKLVGYSLAANHPQGRHKARVFLSALGITAAESKWLSDAILAGIKTSDAEWQADTHWGAVYRVDMDLARGQRRAKVRTAWLCTSGEARLVTCFVIGACDETT